MNNRVPTAYSSIPDQLGLLIGNGWSHSFPLYTFDDADGDTLTYSATGMPSWMSFTQSTRTVSGTPPPGSQGTTAITITASDPFAGTAVDSFTVTGLLLLLLLSFCNQQ